MPALNDKTLTNIRMHDFNRNALPHADWIDIGYTPHPKQKLLHESRAREILFGGAAGGGKSVSLRMDALAWCLRIPGMQVYFFRRTWPEVEKNHIIPSMTEFAKIPQASYRRQEHRWEFAWPGGAVSMLHFCHCQYESDAMKYQGAEIHLLVIDELTTFTAMQYAILTSRARCTLQIPYKYQHRIPGIICATNPGGIGHGWVRQRWLTPAAPLEVWAPKTDAMPMTRQYIPALLEDNPSLHKADPTYETRLDMLPEPYRTAFRRGDWNLFAGQMFDFDPAVHVLVDPPPVPENRPVFMTFDWGFGKPFSVGWAWVDNDGRIFRFMEWYGCRPNTPDMGIRLSDHDIAAGILDFEKRAGLDSSAIRRLAPPDCFTHRPDTVHGGQASSTAEVFQEHGLTLTKITVDRKEKVRQFHQRLAQPFLPDGTKAHPMFFVYPNCTDFIRTIPTLQTANNTPEDINTKSEDHAWDEQTLLFLARPVTLAARPARSALLVAACVRKET